MVHLLPCKHRNVRIALHGQNVLIQCSLIGLCRELQHIFACCHTVFAMVAQAPCTSFHAVYLRLRFGQQCLECQDVPHTHHKEVLPAQVSLCYCNAWPDVCPCNIHAHVPMTVHTPACRLSSSSIVVQPLIFKMPLAQRHFLYANNTTSAPYPHRPHALSAASLSEVQVEHVHCNICAGHPGSSSW